MNQPVQSPYHQKIFEHLQFQGSSNDCAPYTTATILNTFCNQQLKGDELAKQMNKPRLRGLLPVIRRIPNWATFPWGVVDVMKDYQLKARWQFRTPIEYLRPALANGHILMPIIGEWRPKPWMHIMTLVEWDPQRGWGFANTQYQTQKTYWVSDSDFQVKWKNSGRLLVEIESI
ncbi:MAG TPA: hypothetical protein DEH25_06880 [Chloroflexi bacterium]|nr:hypothetical protein [Chloroflexota bacterium]HBY09423.1 hypothetical protein [Chloroflexota bacterium]